MPVENIKPLYKGKCLDDLKNFYDIPELDPKRLCKTAPKLFKAAEEARISGDEEISYIYYMKFLSIVTRVKQYQKSNKRDINDSSDIKSVEVKEALEYAERLSKSLQMRYKELKQKEAEANKIKETKIMEKITESNLKPLVSSCTPGLADISEGFISCGRLYNLLDTKKKVLIMDVRPPPHFSDSKFKFNCVINVPETIVKAGMSAQKLEKELPIESINPWSHRGNVDLVVLVDWSSSVKNLKSDSSVSVLKEILTKWDSNIQYKNPPVVLEGGFDEWLYRYPGFTTNPTTKYVPIFENVSSADFSGIEYPNLTDNSESSQPSVDRSSKPAMNVSNSPMSSAPSNTFAKCVTPKSSKTVPSNTYSPVPTKTPVPTKGSSSSSASTVSRPSIDRKSKAAAVLTYEERSKNVQALLRKQENVVASSLELEQNKQKIEDEREQIRLRREMEAEEEMRLQLQEREEELLRDIQQKEQLQQEKDKEIKALKAELAEYKKREQEETFTKENIIYKKQEEEISARIRSTEEKRKKLQQDREKKMNEDPCLKKKTVVGEERGQSALTYEERERLAHAKLQHDRLMKKKQEEIAREKERGDSENNRPVVHGTENEQKTVQALNEQNIYFKNKMNGTFTVPLKDTSSGIMKRSHSSPNIAQMNDEELNPRGKPYKPSYLPEGRSSRQRNFSPVWGNMGRGLTGLKNLGNTCYMNSIIQCLSNTTPLARYFVSGDYRGDINRQTETRGEIAEELAAVVRAIWSSSYKSIAARDLRCVVGRHRDQFQTNQQQDSNEFLTILMDWLHEDLKKPSVRSTNDSVRELPDWEKQWNEFYKENTSLIVYLFYGQQKSTVTCLKCNKESVRYETFSNLTLPLLSNINSCSLEDCVQLYVQGEKITGWKCPACKEQRDAKKKFDIIKLPPILIIHFKRFYIDGWCRKRQTFVQFPLKDFDMRKYTLFSDQKYTKFNLYGVSNHYGTMEGGHYTAYCKSAEHKKWYKFDDNEVSEISSSEVQSGAAYILFYASVNLTIPDVS